MTLNAWMNYWIWFTCIRHTYKQYQIWPGNEIVSSHKITCIVMIAVIRSLYLYRSVSRSLYIVGSISSNSTIANDWLLEISIQSATLSCLMHFQFTLMGRKNKTEKRQSNVHKILFEWDSRQNQRSILSTWLVRGHQIHLNEHWYSFHDSSFHLLTSLVFDFHNKTKQNQKISINSTAQSKLNR